MKTVEFTCVLSQQIKGVHSKFEGKMDLEDSLADEMVKQGYGRIVSIPKPIIVEPINPTLKEVKEVEHP